MIDSLKLGDLIRESYLKHGKDSWVSIAKDVIRQMDLDEKTAIRNKDVEFVKFRKDLLEAIPGYKFDLETIEKIERVCKQIMVAKDKDYGGSWQKDGLLSAHLNLKRKFDRLHNLFMSGFDTEVGDETVLDTLIDLRNYTTLYLKFLTKKDLNYFVILDDLDEPDPITTNE